jgi:hypothetical protein
MRASTSTCIFSSAPGHVAATSLEFSFTDGVNWDGPYKLFMEIPEKLKGLPQSYFNAVRIFVFPFFKS